MPKMCHFIRVTKENFNKIKPRDMVYNVASRGNYNIVHNDNVMIVRNNIVRDIFHVNEILDTDIPRNTYNIDGVNMKFVYAQDYINFKKNKETHFMKKIKTTHSFTVVERALSGYIGRINLNRIITYSLADKKTILLYILKNPAISIDFKEMDDDDFVAFCDREIIR